VNAGGGVALPPAFTEYDAFNYDPEILLGNRAANMKHAVFFERDGILNRVRIENQRQWIPKSLEDLELNPDALPLLRRLGAAGFVLIATTNQPALSTGTLSRRELDRMHTRLRQALPLHEVMVCPHTGEDECLCRKPKPGLLIEAAFKWRLDLAQSFVVSDKWQDATAAALVGATSLLLESPWLRFGRRDLALPNLSAIGDRILRIPANQRAFAA
jgi:D-glycero-D-manno-heptose 1,7-bisphosphate phosphatase